MLQERHKCGSLFGVGGPRVPSEPAVRGKMKGSKQTTLCDRVTVSGIGVHSGKPVTLTLHPGDDDSGIVFQRVAADGSVEREIRADVRAVTATEFATVLGDASGPLCSTAEHLLAALRGLNVDNVVVEIDGPEVPIMDGSASAFVDALDQVGLTMRAVPRRFIEVIKPMQVKKGASFGELRPYEHGFRVEAEIDFDHPLIGNQALSVDIEPKTFRRELARARTFGFLKDVTQLWSVGYARGASLDNTLVVSDDRVLNADGLRYPDEFVRHKILDAVGDLALAGLPLLAAYRTVRGGHKLNYAVLCALMKNPAAWRVVEVVQPARRPRGHADVSTGLVAPAYRPNVS
jgi:UDP-3-O-[3-hydroxymyristoyl] N-acetylglucosamine deacetylase